jgi:hypothetical protein
MSSFRDRVYSSYSASIYLLIQASQTKEFWRSIPYTLCRGGLASEANETCWTGSSRGYYQSLLIGDGLRNQFNNPEFPAGHLFSSGLVINQILKLNVATLRLTNAYEDRSGSRIVSQ